MSTVHVTLSKPTGRSPSLSYMSVPGSVPVAADTMTTSAAKALCTITQAQVDLFWTIVPRDADVWAVFSVGDAEPGPDAGHLLLAGQPRDFSVTVAGEKLYLKDA